MSTGKKNTQWPVLGSPGQEGAYVVISRKSVFMRQNSFKTCPASIIVRGMKSTICQSISMPLISVTVSSSHKTSWAVAAEKRFVQPEACVCPSCKKCRTEMETPTKVSWCLMSLFLMLCICLLCLSSLSRILHAQSKHEWSYFCNPDSPEFLLKSMDALSVQGWG